MEAATVVVAQEGMSRLMEFGIAGVLLAILLAFQAYMLYYFMGHCERRTTASENSFKGLTEKVTASVDNNTAALGDVKIAMAKLEGKIER